MKNLKAERELSLDFLRVTEAAAIESAKTMGQGDRKYSDHVAVEAMREVMDTVPMRGRIVIGEGERDEAPMLYIGEELGGGVYPEEARADFPDHFADRVFVLCPKARGCHFRAHCPSQARMNTSTNHFRSPL